MIDVILTIFWGVVLLSVIVVIHEGGHYLAARLFKVRVLEFMVGLPGPRIGFRPKRSRTRFGVTCVPLGGYARIAGMDLWANREDFPRAAALLYRYGELSEDDVERATDVLGFDVVGCLDALDEWGTVEKGKTADKKTVYRTPELADSPAGTPRPLEDPEGFIESERSETYLVLPWWKRVVICLAGPLANLVTAVVTIVLILTLVGTTVASTTLDQVVDGYPAQEAGLLAGDKIVSLDGVEIASWEDFSVAIDSIAPETEVTIGFIRDGEQMETVMTTVDAGDGTSMIGVVAGTELYHYSAGEALGVSFAYIGQVVDAILDLVNPSTAAETISQSSSVVGVSVVAKQAAELGLVNFAWLAGMLSVSIGLMNLLPLMPLDGGRIVVETIQRITRRLLPPAFVNVYSSVGIFLVMILFVVVVGQDIGNIVTGNFPF